MILTNKKAKFGTLVRVIIKTKVIIIIIAINNNRLYNK